MSWRYCAHARHNDLRTRSVPGCRAHSSSASGRIISRPTTNSVDGFRRKIALQGDFNRWYHERAMNPSPRKTYPRTTALATSTSPCHRNASWPAVARSVRIPMRPARGVTPPARMASSHRRWPNARCPFKGRPMLKTHILSPRRHVGPGVAMRMSRDPSRRSGGASTAKRGEAPIAIPPRCRAA